MKILDHVRDELKDVRLIHFSLLAVSATVLYLVFSAWSEAPELGREVSRLRETVGNLATDQPTADHLAVLLDAGWVEQLAGRVREAIGAAIGEPLGWGAGVRREAGKLFRVLATEPVPPRAGGTLEGLRGELGHLKWRLELPERFEGRTDAIRDWLAQEKKRTIPPPGRNLPGPNETIILESILGVSGPDLFGVLMDPSTGPDAVKVTLGLTYTQFLTKQVRDPSTQVTSSKNETSVFTDSKDVTLEWVGRKEVVELPQGWFERTHPRVIGHWESLRAMTLDEARRWADEQRTARLEGRKNPSFLGVEIESVYVGWVGPILVTCLLFYLLAHLLNLLKLLESESHFGPGPVSIALVSPWVGAMKSGLAVGISIVTLILLPIAAIWLPLWRFLSFSGWWLLLWGMWTLIAGLLGCFCSLIGRQIAQRSVPDVP